MEHVHAIAQILTLVKQKECVLVIAVIHHALVMEIG